MLDILVDAYPEEVSKDDLADRLDMVVTGGTFNTYAGTLVRNGLARRADGGLVADPVLFPEVRRAY